MKEKSKMGFLIGIIFLLGILLLVWKLPQSTSDLQGERQSVEEKTFHEMTEWENPRTEVLMVPLFHKTSEVLIFEQFRMTEQPVKDESIGRYQLFYIVAFWYIGLLLPQLTVRGLRKKFIAKSTALWHNINYVHRGDGKKKLSVAAG